MLERPVVVAAGVDLHPAAHFALKNDGESVAFPAPPKVGHPARLFPDLKTGFLYRMFIS